MSWIKHYYHDEICAMDDGDWAYEQMRDRDVERQFEEEERQQQEDEGYSVISIDYSAKSWEQFDADLKDPSSELVKALEKLGQPPF